MPAGHAFDVASEPSFVLRFTVLDLRFYVISPVRPGRLEVPRPVTNVALHARAAAAAAAAAAQHSTAQHM
jgi:hypothetical protein